eukprot:6746528-Pyramimonas_sp.AAC.1
MDRRRVELAVALFYETYREKDARLCDVSEDHGGPPENLSWFIPSFKSKMLERAEKKNVELGAESVRRLSFGSHSERVGKALADAPFRAPRPPRPRAADQ